jgi:hypothetical protein
VFAFSYKNNVSKNQKEILQDTQRIIIIRFKFAATTTATTTMMMIFCYKTTKQSNVSVNTNCSSRGVRLQNITKLTHFHCAENMESDAGLQRAIYESLKSRSSQATTPSRQYIGRSNTLSREGIAPANSRAFAGSKFGRSTTRRHSATDQQKVDESMPRKFFAARKPSHITDTGTSSASFLGRHEWITLGDGWFQATPLGTGSSSRFGLHSVVESSLGQLYICIYEPRTQLAAEACNSESPQYDLEVSAKTVLAKNSPKLQCFEIIFAFKSATDYMFLRCDVDAQSWSLCRNVGGEMTSLAIAAVDSEVAGAELKPNLFYSVLIQVRNGNTISVDVDGVPIFTAVRLPDPGSNCSGLMGLLAKVRAGTSRRHYWQLFYVFM